MSRKHGLQSEPAAAQHVGCALDTSHLAADFRGPWFNTITAAAYLQISTAAAFRKWALRHDIQFRYRGRRVLVAKADLDRAIGASPRVSLRRVGA